MYPTTRHLYKLLPSKTIFRFYSLRKPDLWPNNLKWTFVYPKAEKSGAMIKDKVVL